jgi:iron complex outermembrane receptor protein
MSGATTRCASRTGAPILVLALVVAPPAALADGRAEAKRHFREGMSLIAAGQVERGIAELKQAYAIKPHPDVLYDIARAYVDVGNIAEALNYFRQYVATDPADKEQVQKMIRRLESAIGSAPAATAAAPAPVPGAASLPTSPAELEKMMAQLKELLQKAQQQQQQQGTPEAKAAAKAQDAPAHSDEDMFEEQTISPRAAAPSAAR